MLPALAEVARRLGAKFAALADERGGGTLRDALSGTGIASGAGQSAVLEAVGREADVVLAAISGTAGLAPTHAALKPGRRIALANKESLVCAGAAFMADARRLGVEIMPVDSEHNALDHALAAGSNRDVEKAVITASGGPFRTWTRRAHRDGRCQGGFGSSGLVHGLQDQHRLGHPDEQGPRTDRGPPPVRSRGGAPGRSGPSRGHRSWAGAMVRRCRHRRPSPAGHEGTDRQRPASSGTAADGPAASRSCRDWPFKLRPA